MSLLENEKADFFISYTSVDSEIAEWIAWQLEETSYIVVFQKWDFIPGSSFVREMRGALEYAHKMVAVISDAYFKSKFAMSEWDAAFAKDPDGMKRDLIPVRVEKFDVSGLAKPRVYIDIIGCDEHTAKKKLLAGVEGKRQKPISPPKYPLSKQPVKAQQEPRQKSVKPQPAMFSKEITPNDDIFIPTIKKKWTDKDKDAFLKEAFERIYDYFVKAKAALESEHPEIEVNLEQITSRKFVCRLYKDGTKKNSCKIWISESFGHGQLGFFEGFAADSGNDNSFNEILTTSEADDNLYLSVSMFSFFGARKSLDKDRLTSEEAGEYLWKHFSETLRY